MKERGGCWGGCQLVSGVVKLFLCATAHSHTPHNPPYRTYKEHCFTPEEFRAPPNYVRTVLIMWNEPLSEMTVGLRLIGLQWFCCHPPCL